VPTETLPQIFFPIFPTSYTRYPPTRFMYLITCEAFSRHFVRVSRDFLPLNGLAALFTSHTRRLSTTDPPRLFFFLFHRLISPTLGFQTSLSRVTAPCGPREVLSPDVCADLAFPPLQLGPRCRRPFCPHPPKGTTVPLPNFLSAHTS